MAATEVQGLQPTPLPFGEDKAARIASLNGLRGFAVLMVVVVHSSALTEYAWLGVHSYGPVSLFVLSGFLLYRPWARWVLDMTPRPSVRAFAIRRAARIFPAYMVVFLVWVFVYPPAMPQDWQGWAGGLTLWSSLQFDQIPPGLVHIWSLGTELTWYVVLPLLGVSVWWLLSLAKRRHSVGLHAFLLMLSAVVSATWVWASYEFEIANGTLWLPRYLVAFALGALISMLLEAERAGRVRLTGLRRGMSNPLLLGAAVVLMVGVNGSSFAGEHGASYVPSVAEDVVRYLSALGLAFILLMGATLADTGSLISRGLSAPWLQTVGRWSYGVFLWHLPVVVILWSDFSLTGPGGLAVTLVLVTLISVLCGAASFAWVETPIMDRSRVWSARFDPARSTARSTAQPTDRSKGRRAARSTTPPVSSGT